MTEKLLQFIWRYQYFNRSELRTEQGESIQVIETGTWNTNQGPDFLGAKIRLNETTWAGHIELHIQTSDWNKHLHFTDSNYTNIILHVVWKNDELPSGPLMQIPVLELQSRVSTILLQRYEEWMNNPHFVPCGRNLYQVHDFVWLKWKERLLIERLQRKSKRIADLLQQSNNHWEESFWWLIARNFGIRINADAFEAVARSIPLNTLAKHKTQIHQLEALLFGQAGLLDKRFVENYPQLLQKEYRFYQKKYRFKKVFVALKFLRMRPSGFPTVRLAQLAKLIQQSTHLFSRIREMDSLKEIRSMLDVTANDYWHYHYRFDEESAFIKKSLGEEMVDNILVNTVLPVLFAYGNLQGESAWEDKVLDWMVAIRAEHNRITKSWEAAGALNLHAYDSQALIELKTEYCDYKRCLECAVGNALLKREEPGGGR